MAKVMNALFSNSAHGRVGALIYEVGRCGQYVKAHVPQHGRPTTAQRQQNYFFGVAADAWRILSDEQKQGWNVKAYSTGVTGYNLFIKENIQHP